MAQKWLEQERAWWCALDNRVEVEKRLEKKGSLPFCVRIAANGEPCLSVRQLDGKFVHSKFTVDNSGACSIVQKGQTVNASSLRGMLEKLGYVEAPPPPQENLYVDFAPVADRVVSTYGAPPIAAAVVKSKGSGVGRSSPTGGAGAAPAAPSSSSGSSGSSGRRRRHRHRSARDVKDGQAQQSDGSSESDPKDYVAVPEQDKIASVEPAGYVALPMIDKIAKSSGSGSSKSKR